MRWRKIEDITHVNLKHMKKDYIIKWEDDKHTLVQGWVVHNILTDAFKTKNILICRITDRPKKTDGLKGEV